VQDAEAVALTLRGDPRGPELLLTRYQMDVYNVSLRMLRNPADAEDATQDVFLRAFSHLHQYRPSQPFGAWLHGITRNRCLDILRGRRPLAELGDRERASTAAAATEDVEATVIARLTSERVRSALDRLTERERSLLVLRYWEDLPTEAVARTLAMSEGAVRVALLRARRSLAVALGGQELGQGLGQDPGRQDLGGQEVGDAV
jgi:RNA polymerase sigma-70 factor, ECF subfamily